MRFFVVCIINVRSERATMKKVEHDDDVEKSSKSRDTNRSWRGQKLTRFSHSTSIFARLVHIVCVWKWRTYFMHFLINSFIYIAKHNIIFLLNKIASNKIDCKHFRRLSEAPRGSFKEPLSQCAQESLCQLHLTITTCRLPAIFIKTN